MADLTINAQPREVVGKKVKKLRREGFVPAVVYGPAVDAPRAVQIERKAFESVYRAAGTSQLVGLAVGAERRTTPVFIRDVQYNMLKRRVDHIDFYAANLRAETTVNVPVVLTGEAPIVRRGEAILNQVVNTVAVRALPTEIPAHIEVDLAGVETLNDDIRVSDLTVPAGVTLVDSPETMIVSVTAPTVEVVEEPVAAEAAAEPEAAEEPEAETAAEAGAGEETA
jgi:large subunit ribosomal protein L25